MTRAWRTIDSQHTDAGCLALRQRSETDFLITIDNRVLMNASANLSEIALAELACASLKGKHAPRVLVGGLGMGFTLKAALDALPDDARVVVAELNPVIVTWCRGPIAHLTGRAVDDPRVEIVIDNVAAVIRQAAAAGRTGRFDAILLDLYEGPHAGDRGRGAYLYGRRALATSRSALTDGGVFAVWSEDPDTTFEKRLTGAGFSVHRQRPGRGGSRHVVYIALKTGPAGRPPRRKKSGRSNR